MSTSVGYCRFLVRHNPLQPYISCIILNLYRILFGISKEDILDTCLTISTHICCILYLAISGSFYKASIFRRLSTQIPPNMAGNFLFNVHDSEAQQRSALIGVLLGKNLVFSHTTELTLFLNRNSYNSHCIQ